MLEFENKKFGFTLAEVLITLGIIGVVAAITMQVLITKSNEAGFKAAWKKTYSVFSNATNKIMQENGGSMVDLTCEETANSPDCMRIKYEEYVNVLKSCKDYQPWGKCFHPLSGNYYDTVKLLDGSSHIYMNTYPFSCSGSSGMILKDGTLVLINYQDRNCQSGPGANVEGLTNVCGWITVDVNGFKAPNTIGKDIFIMLTLKNGLKPAGVGTLSGTCIPTGDGRGCSAKYLYE